MLEPRKDIYFNPASALVYILNYIIGWIIPPIGRNAQQMGNTVAPNDLPDVQTLAQLKAGNYLDEEQYNGFGAMQGFKPEWLKLLAVANESRLSPDQIINLYRRGVIDSDSFSQQMQELKIPGWAQTLMLKATEYFPSPADLVTFAVREVYSPETAKKFGQFEDFPEDFRREAIKAGMTEEQARNFWGAHWQLPSISQGYEMFQRRIISREELIMLLKAQDVMPFWRDKLIEAAYNPLTRVDVRRMYGLGVLDEQDVYNSYLDSGYSPDNAKAMTDFTIRFESNEYTGITRGNIVQAFVNDLISEDEMRSYLKGINFTDKTIDFWVESANFDKSLMIIQEVADDLEFRYHEGQIDLNGIRNELLQHGVPTSFVEGTLNKLIRKKGKKSKSPDKLDLLNWLNTGAIDDATFTKFMRGAGYADSSIQAYLSAAALSVGAGKRKYLPYKTYQSWLKNKIMKEEDFRLTMKEQNYTEVDIQNLINEVL